MACSHHQRYKEDIGLLKAIFIAVCQIYAAGRMIKFFSASTAGSPKKQSDEFAELTERELEILELVARGQNNKEISNRLSLSVKTVQNYVSSILGKLQVTDRLQAIMRARESGMGKKDKQD